MLNGGTFLRVPCMYLCILSTWKDINLTNLCNPVSRRHIPKENEEDFYRALPREGNGG